MKKVQPAWLTARPIAHRGLHDRSRNTIENSLSSAEAAIAKSFAIECDVQLSRDGEAMVFHDFTLERLTTASGRVDEFKAGALNAIECRDTRDRIPTLTDYLARIDDRTPVICEIKSRFDGDLRLAERTARCAAAYTGRLALKSFDPQVIAHLGANRRALGLGDTPLGMIAQADYDDPSDEWAYLPHASKHALANFLHWSETQPDFLSYGVSDLPHAVPFLCRTGLRLPVMTWTVRTPAQVATARQWADQIIFEGMIPP